jgi:hypothetical protein
MERRMRVILMARTAACVAVLVAACSPAANEAAPVETAEAPAAAPAAAPQLKLGCAAPFTPDATAGTLAAAFGAENVVPESLPGPDGITLNVTAIYPNDPKRRIEVTFQNEEARTGLISAEVKSMTSDWVGPGDIQTGESISVVETANGGPFELQGFGWDYGGYVTDWKGGKLANLAPKCRTVMRFASDSSDPAIVGEGPRASNLPAMQASGAKVVSFSTAWETAPQQQ